MPSCTRAPARPKAAACGGVGAHHPAQGTVASVGLAPDVCPAAVAALARAALVGFSLTGPPGLGLEVGLPGGGGGGRFVLEEEGGGERPRTAWLPAALNGDPPPAVAARFADIVCDWRKGGGEGEGGGGPPWVLAWGQAGGGGADGGGGGSSGEEEQGSSEGGGDDGDDGASPPRRRRRHPARPAGSNHALTLALLFAPPGSGRRPPVPPTLPRPRSPALLPALAGPPPLASPTDALVLLAVDWAPGVGDKAGEAAASPAASWAAALKAAPPWAGHGLAVERAALHGPTGLGCLSLAPPAHPGAARLVGVAVHCVASARAVRAGARAGRGAGPGPKAAAALVRAAGGAALAAARAPCRRPPSCPAPPWASWRPPPWPPGPWPTCACGRRPGPPWRPRRQRQG